MRYKFAMPGIRAVLTFFLWAWTIGGAVLAFMAPGAATVVSILSYMAGILALLALCLSIPVNYIGDDPPRS